ncbi:hypothetical protein A3SI_10594 [Nitritalea halalkaliphila LW7]|uniref:Uncharacterized protein n=1 Tax=Nitritalea halalkaliphila LW7 TaxID=1189621 RepID=I5C3P7_9BACT|nr:DUF3822 family protein [Nitritalea halalkaliphila]EIM76449.1 hypothetical protein A3SI_10594 [Nitritalea halalkaliphila LW7]
MHLVLFPQEALVLYFTAQGLVCGIEKYAFTEQAAFIRDFSASFPDHDKLRLRIFYHGADFTLVPAHLAGEEGNKTFLEATCGPQENHVLRSDRVSSWSLQLLYSLPQELLAALPKHWDVEFWHGAFTGLQYTGEEKRKMLKEELVLISYPGFMYIAALGNQRLLSFNRYEINSWTEITQYALGVAEHLNFDRFMCRCSFIGNRQALSIDQNWGAQYFKNFIIDPIKPSLRLHPDLQLDMLMLPLEGLSNTKPKKP